MMPKELKKMKEQIIRYRKDTKELYRNIEVLRKAVKDFEDLGSSKKQAAAAVAKIMGTRVESVVRLLDQRDHPSPRGSYAKVIKKLQEFASAYKEAGGFKSNK